MSLYSKFKNIAQLLKKKRYKVLFSKFGSFIFNWERFFILNIGIDELKIEKREIEGLTTRITGSSDIPGLNEMLGDLEYNLEKLGPENTCMAAEINGSFVGMQWNKIADSHYEHRNRYNIFIGANNAWMFYAFVHHEYRQRGIWRRLHFEMVQYLRSRAVKKIYCLVYKNKPTVIKAHTDLGYKVEREVLHIRFMILNVFFKKVPDGKSGVSFRISL
ncbi:GNAT family N-acetyltransferase [Elusimicrobiota bacterium]